MDLNINPWSKLDELFPQFSKKRQNGNLPIYIVKKDSKARLVARREDKSMVRVTQLH